MIHLSRLGVSLWLHRRQEFMFPSGTEGRLPLVLFVKRQELRQAHCCFNLFIYEFFPKLETLTVQTLGYYSDIFGVTPVIFEASVEIFSK